MKIAPSIGAFAVIAGASGVARLGDPGDRTPIVDVVLIAETVPGGTPHLPAEQASPPPPGRGGE